MILAYTYLVTAKNKLKKTIDGMRCFTYSLPCDVRTVALNEAVRVISQLIFETKKLFAPAFGRCRINTNTGRFHASHTLENHMAIINHILSLPVNQSTLDFALVCAAIVAVRVALSVVLHKLN